MLCISFKFDTEEEERVARVAMEKMCTSLVGFRPFIEDDVVITNFRNYSGMRCYNVELIINKEPSRVRLSDHN